MTATVAFFLLRCKACWIALGVLALIAAGWFYIESIKDNARAEVIQEQKALTDAEHTRREAVVKEAHDRADAAEARYNELERYRAAQQNEIERFSAANDLDPCLDPDSLRRLRALGQPPRDGVDAR